jgi:hypothetical protein
MLPPYFQLSTSSSNPHLIPLGTKLSRIYLPSGPSLATTGYAQRWTHP